MDLKDIKIGQEYYWSPRGYYYGKVPAKIKITEISNGIPRGNIIEPKIHGTQGFHINRMFETEQEARDHYDNELNTVKDNYRKQINSIQDLVVFCLNNCVASAEEHTNWEARQVAIEKAKEFGIEIQS